MKKQALSKRQQGLVELMQHLNFGRITFHVRGGEPDFSQMYRTLRTVKLSSGKNGPRQETASADFELRKEHVALLKQLKNTSNGSRLTVEVKHGLPFLIEIEEEHHA